MRVHCAMKLTIWASILDCPVEQINDDYHISHIAYLASVAEYSDTTCNALSCASLDLINNSRSVNAMFTLLDYYNTFASNNSSHKSLRCDDVIRLDKDYMFHQ